MSWVANVRVAPDIQIAEDMDPTCAIVIGTIEAIVSTDHIDMPQKAERRPRIDGDCRNRECRKAIREGLPGAAGVIGFPDARPFVTQLPRGPNVDDVRVARVNRDGREAGRLRCMYHKAATRAQ